MGAALWTGPLRRGRTSPGPRPGRPAARAARVGAVVLLALLGAAQLVPLRRTNPPEAAPLTAPAEVQAVLERSCADCHTNHTRWPWYAHTAPMSWLVVHHVNTGRQNLNFSFWNLLPLKEQQTHAKAVVDQVTAGAMPIRSYLLIHRDARLSADDARLLRAWFSSPAATPGPRPDSSGANLPDAYWDP